MLSDEFTAGGIRASEGKRKLMAKESLEFNFKKEKEFAGLFGEYFQYVGIDGETKQAMDISE